MSKSSGEAEESTECPTCEQTFDTYHGLTIHHSVAHGEPLPDNFVNCHHCGGEFRLPEWRQDRAERHFCTKECRADWLSEENTGEDHPQWAGDEAELECEWCDEQFRRWPSVQENRAGRFCSHGCYMEWVQDTPREESGIFGPIRAGEDSLRWRGGKFPYGKGWNGPKRRAVRERDGHECVSCGMSQSSHLDECGQKLDVHHVTPARDVSDPEERNAMDNLVTLCRDCHSEWEKMAPLRPISN